MSDQTSPSLATKHSFGLGLLVLFVVFAATVTPARANSIAFTLMNPAQIGSANQTLVFTGSITNTSGVTLNATDLSFSFFGFDSSLTVTQLLGSTDFSIPTGTTSSIVALFSVTLGSVVPSGVLPVQFVIQDVNGNVTKIGKVTITTATVPESSSASLIALGLAVAAAFKHKRNFLARVPS